MLIDSLLQLIGMVPYIVGLILFVVGAPDSSGYDSTYSDYRPVEDPGNTGLMVAGGLLAAAGRPADARPPDLEPGVQAGPHRSERRQEGDGHQARRRAHRAADRRRHVASCATSRTPSTAFVYLGYLWPLWDDKRQTFADKILSTVVVEMPKI